MNILFITDSYEPQVNGIVKHIQSIKKELERRNHKIIILAPSYAKTKKIIANETSSIYQMPSVPFLLRPVDRMILPSNKKVKEILTKTPIDIIHNQESFWMQSIGIKIAQDRHVPQISTFHTPFYEYLRWMMPWTRPLAPSLTHWICQLFHNEFDLLLAPSKKAADILKGTNVKTPIKILHNGIELENFTEQNPELFRKTYNLKPDTQLIVLVGRIDLGKNVDLAVETMRKIAKTIPNIKLAIIGDGEKRKDVEKLIKKYQLEKNIFITGFLNSEMVKSANQAADLAIMMSDSDIFPTVAIEAISCGKAMVAVNDPAITEIIKHGVNGILTSKDPTKIANAILKLLKNRKLRNQYEQAGLKLSKQFSVKKYVDQLLIIYRDQIKQKHDELNEYMTIMEQKKHRLFPLKPKRKKIRLTHP